MLQYTVSGEGTPVVFIHGFLESNSMWEQILPALSGIKSIAIELSGHANSPAPKADLSIVQLAEKVVGILETEKIAAFSIVGHSLGGYVALEVGKQLGVQRCKKIVLLNSHPFEDSEIKKAERTQVARIVTTNKSLFIKQSVPNLFRNAANHKAEVDQLIEEALTMEAEAIALTTLAMRDRTSCEEVLEKYGNLLTVIQGKHDNLIPFEKMQEITSKYENNFFLLEEAGHMAHVEAYEEVVNYVMRVVD
jgi:pimeloyl-ACP methyl ester carboxylesterase